MCGICGIVNLLKKPIDLSEIKRLNYEIKHRGPDDEGYLIKDDNLNKLISCSGFDTHSEITFKNISFYTNKIKSSLVLGHRRFSIIDISSGGHQPFVDESCRYSISFNGEIYNYIEIREELINKGVCFRTKSDTEVFLQAYKYWGGECFKKLDGFWAAAIYDMPKDILIFSRDRAGKKPLYWMKCGDSIYFSSEIKSLIQYKTPTLTKNEDIIANWLKFQKTGGTNETFFEGIYSFPNASWAIVDENFPNNMKKFWEIPKNRLTDNDISVDEAAKNVFELLDYSVRLRLRTDVPLAVELSGGLDSSVIAYLASNYDKNLPTYTVKFEDKECDESSYAKIVADHLGLKNNIIYPKINNFWQIIDSFVWLHEEPFHMPNLYSNMEIWAEMKTHGFQVSLNGAAGDELFAGYGYYFSSAQYENIKNGKYFEYINNILRYSESNMLVSLKSSIPPKIRLIINKIISKNVEMTLNRYMTLSDILLADFNENKIPYWLRSGDKNSMGLPFEVRMPFLDYKLMEYIFILPYNYIFHNGWHKWILRKAFQNHLPKKVIWRKKKMGFPFPYKDFIQRNEKIFQRIISYGETFNLHDKISNNSYAYNKYEWRYISFLLWRAIFVDNNMQLFQTIKELAYDIDEKNLEMGSFIKLI